MRRLTLTTAALGLCACLAGAQQSPLIVRVNMPDAAAAIERVPVCATVPSDTVKAWWGAEPPASPPASAVETLADGSMREVAVQIAQVEPGLMRLCALLPSQPAGARELRVYRGRALPAQLAGATPVEGRPVTVVHDPQGVVRVTNPSYSITHDPAKMGGLPSSIQFAPTSKVFDTYLLNDRIFAKGVGAYWLRNDPEPEVELLAEGPVFAELRVRARYLSEGGGPESQAYAVYHFRYYGDLPLIEVQADCFQEPATFWNELHLLEINFKDDIFTQFVSANPVQQGVFDDDKSVTRGSEWGALVDGESALAILGRVYFYDGKNDYGRYIHGPSQSWDQTRAGMHAWMWVGAGPDALERIGAAAQVIPVIPQAVVLTSEVAGMLDRLDEAIGRMPEEGMRARYRWMRSLAAEALARAESAPAAGEVIARLVQDAAAGAADPVGGVPPQIAEALIAGDSLGMALRDWRIASLFDMRGAREMLAEPSDVFRVELSAEDGRRLTVGSSGAGDWQSCRMDSGPGAPLTITWREPRREELAGLEVTVSSTGPNDPTAWRIAINNPTPWSIETVTFPTLRLRALGDDATDDTLYYPEGFGRALPVAGLSLYRRTYPSGSCTMQFMALTDDEGGLYLAAQDPTAMTKVLAVSPDGRPGTLLAIEYPAPDASRPGNDFATEWLTVLDAVGGGWFPAARRYRDWVESEAPWWPEPGEYSRSDIPGWLEDTCTWALTGGTSEQVVEPVKAFAEYMGVPTAVHWYNWHEIPFDNDYPHYFPTKPGFAEGVAALQQAGVRVTPYINGRLWDTDTEDFASEGIRWCTKDRQGKPYIEVYGSKQELAPMCPTQEPWRKILEDTVLRLMTECGVDGVYLDQIGAAGPRLCYDASHGHPLAGGCWWVPGYWELLGRLQSEIARVSPEKMLTTESNAEPYAKYFDTYLMCNSLGQGLVPLFPAVYGGKILTFGRYMSTPNFTNPSALAQKQGQLFVWGAQLWWSQPQIVDYPEAAQWLRDLARVRQQVREFFNHGRMVAPPVLEGNEVMVTADWHRREAGDMMVTTPAVLASAWQLEDGRVMIALVNCAEQEMAVTLRLDPLSWHLPLLAKLRVEEVTAGGARNAGVVEGMLEREVRLGPVGVVALVLTPGW